MAQERSVRVERKLAAILAADIAGYSRLTGADEERTQARLRALRGDRSGDRGPWRPGREAHRRRHSHRVSQRRGCGALRTRSAERNAERNAGLPPEEAASNSASVFIPEM